MLPLICTPPTPRVPSGTDHRPVSSLHGICLSGPSSPLAFSTVTLVPGSPPPLDCELLEDRGSTQPWSPPRPAPWDPSGSATSATSAVSVKLFCQETSVMGRGSEPSPFAERDTMS